MTSTATDPHPSDEELTGGELKRRLARALRRQKIRALLLIAPLLLFILLGFIAPIGSMLFRSVENNIVGDIMPNTVAALQSPFSPDPAQPQRWTSLLRPGGSTAISISAVGD